MRGVAVALPLSIVGILNLGSAAWACGDFDRPGDLCGRDERGPPGFRWNRPGRDKGEGERFIREKTERERATGKILTVSGAKLKIGQRKRRGKPKQRCRRLSR